MDITNTLSFHNGVKIPQLGLGVFQASDDGEVENAIKWAINAGYRHIDTAAIYRNEEGVGRAIANSNVSREELFITTKVWNSDQGYDTTLKAFEQSLKKLGLDYIDLYLIHWPKPNSSDTWRAMEYLYQQGKVKSIGVSNFMINHLEDLLKTAKIIPMINQVEFHPYLQQNDLVEFCEKHNILYEAWSPLMRGEVSKIDLLKEIGNKYNKSPFQVVIRWNLQRGIVVIPKSVTQNRIIANSDVFDFELTQEEVKKINLLDKGERIGPDPNNFDF